MTNPVTPTFDLNRALDRLNSDLSHALRVSDLAYARKCAAIAWFIGREVDTLPVRSTQARASAVARFLEASHA
jgi:hypothetical protein